jgi:hypothetical protein
MKLLPIAPIVPILLALAPLTAAADPAPPARSLYRLDVTINGLGDGPRPAPATYTLFLEEHATAELSTGLNLPISGATSVTRQDVGLQLKFSYELRGAAVILGGQIELSSAEPGPGAAPGSPTLRRLRATSVVAVTPGTPALFTSVTDAATHRRTEVTVAVQRML